MKTKFNFWGVVAMTVAVLCLIPLTTNALTAGGISIAPASNLTFPDRNKGWFIYEQVEPGTVIEDVARVINLDSQEATLAVEGVDAGMNEDGGFGLVGSPEDNQDIGKWIELSKTEVTLGAKKEEIIPFKITVPADAEVGDHIGALAVYQTTPTTNPTVRVKGGSQVSISTRVGARIYLTVKGDIIRGLKVLKKSMFGRGQSIVFGFKIKNLGNVRADLKMTAKIYSIWGLYDKKEDVQIGQVFPKKTISIQAPWPGKSRPIFGLYWASVTVDDTFKGLNPLNSPLPPSTPIRFWTATFFIPWTQVGMGLLILFLVWFVVQLWRWRRLVRLARMEVVAYKVKKGDHLVDIADDYDISWKLLAQLNGVKSPYSLRNVTTLYVPDARGSRRDMPIPRFWRPLLAPVGRWVGKLRLTRKPYYVIVVERGDKQKDVEQFTGLSWGEIAKYNALSRSFKLRVGVELKIPKKKPRR